MGIAWVVHRVHGVPFRQSLLIESIKFCGFNAKYIWIAGEKVAESTANMGTRSRFHSVDMCFDWSDNRIFDKLIENSIIGNAMNQDTTTAITIGTAQSANVLASCISMTLVRKSGIILLGYTFFWLLILYPINAEREREWMSSTNIEHYKGYLPLFRRSLLAYLICSISH